MKEQKLKIKDLVTIGVFAVIYVVIIFALGMIGFLPVLYLVYPALLGIVSGTVIMLFMAKVQKPWAVLILGMLTFAIFNTWICGSLMQMLWAREKYIEIAMVMGEEYVNALIKLVIGLSGCYIRRTYRSEYRKNITKKTFYKGRYNLMYYINDKRLNPNPITKFFVVVLLGFTVVHSINHYLEIAAVLAISIMYLINGFRREAIKNILVFGVLFFVPSFSALAKLPIFIMMMLSLPAIFRMFYLPFAAGEFMIKTSDVGSIISSMDALKIPKEVSVPIAVMFRFFPSFAEEKNNIMMAMRIRGIETKNPVKYLEYIAVPLLIISSNIADDIAKAAETKCIANPVKKTRYIKVKIHLIDFIYAFTMIIIVVGGLICLR